MNRKKVALFFGVGHSVTMVIWNLIYFRVPCMMSFLVRFIRGTLVLVSVAFFGVGTPTSIIALAQQSPLNQQQSEKLALPMAAQDKDLLRVALLVPLTGQYEALGQDFLAAAQIALFDVASTKIMLQPYDTKGTKQGAKNATQQAMNRGAHVILGPFLSGNLAPVKQALGNNTIPILSFSNDVKTLLSLEQTDTVVNTSSLNIWGTGFLPQQQVWDILVYAQKMGRKNLAVFSPDNAYGRLITELAVSIGTTLDIKVIATDYYDSTKTDFSQQIKTLTRYDARNQQYKSDLYQLRQVYEQGGKSNDDLRKKIEWLTKNPQLSQPDFDMILVPALSEIVLRSIAAQLSFYEVDPKQIKILGLQPWDKFTGIFKEPSLRRAWFVAPDRIERQKFNERFQAAYGRKPHRLASLAWDSMALVSVLRANQGMRGFIEHLTEDRGFRGVDGIFRLRNNGLVERPGAIYEVTPTGIRVIQPAPQQFFVE